MERPDQRIEYFAFNRLLQNSTTKNPITTVRLIASEGGIRKAELVVSQLFKENHLRTEARSHCLSACALVFLAGETRILLPANDSEEPTILAFHGYYHPTTLELVTPQPEDINYLIESTNGRISRQLAWKILQTRDHNGGLIVFEPSTARKLGKVPVSYCDKPADSEVATCETLDKSAHDLGLISASQ